MVVTKKIKRIGLFTGTRAEYGLLYPVLKAVREHPVFEPMLFVSGSHLDEKFGRTLSEIEDDGFKVDHLLSLPNMAKNMAVGCGALMQQMGQLLTETSKSPDCLIVLGDRYETLGASAAAFLSNVPLFHIHGGDVVRGGMLDDPIRHAITKLAHLHFPITQSSAERILRLGEEPWRVIVTGSPVVDNIRMIEVLPREFFIERYKLSPDKPWVLFTQHPITTEPDLAGPHARETLEALASFKEEIEIIATYPNHDQGSMDIIDLLENHYGKLPQFHIVKSLGRLQYLNILRYVSLMIGNSSSGLLESAHFKIPCINIGERQKDRERGGNVIDVSQDQEKIREAIYQVLYNTELNLRLKNAPHPFGEGCCAEKIIETLENITLNEDLLRKQITY